MNRPEYWEDEETWAAFLDQSQQEPALTGLSLAIARARGEITCEEDMRKAIELGNQLWAHLTSRSSDKRGSFES